MRTQRLSPLHVLQAVALLSVVSVAPSALAGEPPESLWRAGADPLLQTQWALAYEHGEGVAKDMGLALRLYCGAGRRGHAEAQYRVGWIYANGRGVPRDEPLARAWLSRAAGAGDPHAARLLEWLGNEPAARALHCPGAAPGAAVTAAAARQVRDEVRARAARWGLEPELVLALIQVESGFNRHAVSPKGAQGLMQLMPGTAARFGVRDAFDVAENLAGGMAYLRWLLLHFDNDLRLALAGYNAGEEAVERYQGVPPYAETVDYVRRVLALYGKQRHPPLIDAASRSRALSAASHLN